ncbi:branched-chain amino acid ABC transporter permease [Arthrobacter sp. AZCC_0090]|uniref:branched-chain amino acid ABC transporter permease n=1 Tax=Arthrobacter sp. AZCC_0090 TaxID=2735881 RepID=UPI00161013C5|nr:branched-chain amino acid ABC transporter permease [Arthrobacter sp. AZCC_0090]MBB6407165.1 branched-chain amino acid transport system permease protein [Arthrobacter sp. AZCC_0090]
MTGYEVLQTFFSGLALGASYAILALGFVIVFAATKVLNFAQGAFVLIGAYLTFEFESQLSWPFPIAIVMSMLVSALIGILIERTVIRRFSHSQAFAAVMATVGLLFASQAVVAGFWGDSARNLGDPWGLETVRIFGAAIAVSGLWAIGLSSVLLGLVFGFLRFSRGGLSMRASVSDQEAAIAQGINPRRVAAVAWGLAGASGAVAGVLLATGSNGVNGTLAVAAFAALPAMVLGGLDSPIGALLGGLIIGMVQQFTSLLQPVYLSGLGSEFSSVIPYLVLIVVLLIRPQGLFGTRAVQRF